MYRKFPKMFGKGFSERNLWNFKRFDLVCPDFENFTHDENTCTFDLYYKGARNE